MNEKEKAKQEKFFLEQSPDGILGGIKVKISELEERIINKIKDRIIKNRIDDAAEILKENLDLLSDEAEHLLNIPRNVFLDLVSGGIEGNKEEIKNKISNVNFLDWQICALNEIIKDFSPRKVKGVFIKKLESLGLKLTPQEKNIIKNELDLDEIMSWIKNETE